MKRKIFAVLSALCLLCSLCICAGAAGFYSDSLETDQTGSTFVSGYSVTSAANVDGIAFLAGENILCSGKNEYTAAAARTVTLEGDTRKDAFAAGQNLTIRGNVGRDLFAAAQSLDVSGDVGGNVYAAADTVFIRGHVAGDVYLSAETIVIPDSSSIAGTLHYPSSAEITASDSILSGAVVEEVPEPEEMDSTPSFGARLADKIFSFLGLAALALVLLWLTPLWETLDSRYTGKPFGKYAAAFGIGFGTLFGVPLAAIVLMITRVGLRLAFVLLAVYIAALIAAGIFAAFFVGSLLWRNALKKQPKLWAELLIGTAAWTILGCLPGVSFLVGLVGVPFGLGVITLLITSSKPPRARKTPRLPEATEE